MKRVLVLAILLFLSLILCGCSSEKTNLPDEQQKAVENSIDFISASSFNDKDQIDTDIVKIDNVTDKTWKSVWSDGKQISKDVIDVTDWMIFIGDTSYRDYTIIICDSATSEVIGYIPIE